MNTRSCSPRAVGVSALGVSGTYDSFFCRFASNKRLLSGDSLLFAYYAIENGVRETGPRNDGDSSHVRSFVKLFGNKLYGKGMGKLLLSCKSDDVTAKSSLRDRQGQKLYYIRK